MPNTLGAKLINVFPALLSYRYWSAAGLTDKALLPLQQNLKQKAFSRPQLRVGAAQIGDQCLGIIGGVCALDRFPPFRVYGPDFFRNRKLTRTSELSAYLVNNTGWFAGNDTVNIAGPSLESGALFREKLMALI